MNKSKNLIFLHIPRNAGTSFFYLLSTQYAPQERFDIKVINDRKMNTGQLAEMCVEEREKIKLVSGHTRFGIHEHLVGASEYITFLRNPMARIQSFYYFVKSHPNHRLYPVLSAGKMSLYDFVTKMPQGDINNAQTRMIAGINAPPELMLERALQNIQRHFAAVLITERFDQSVVIFKHLYQVKRVRYLKSNQADNRELPDIDAKTEHAIRAHNAADFELYEKLIKKFDQRWQNVHWRRLHLAQLRIKNQILCLRAARQKKTEKPGADHDFEE